MSDPMKGAASGATNGSPHGAPRHAHESATGAVRDLALRALIVGVIGIAIAYATAFFSEPVARLGPWIMAVLMPITMFAMMVLGAVRAGRGIGPLAIPFVVVFVLVAGGFVFALWLPPEAVDTPLWLGLPPRAAVILFGVGLLPLFMLPIVYALTFDAFTLNDEDIARVRAARLPGANPKGGTH